MAQDPYILFGGRLRELRTMRKLSQEKLAEMSDVHRNFIGLAERGKENLTLEKLTNIARALKIWPGDLFDHFPRPKQDRS